MTETCDIALPATMTDSELAQIVERELPAVLISKFGYNATHAEMLAEKLAPAIVDRARESLQLNTLAAHSSWVCIATPTQNQCSQFQDALDDVLYLPVSAKKDTIKVWAGRLWSLVTHEDEHWDDNKTNAVVGVRG
ncbi:MAG: hypothetical protein ACLQLC_03750 [Candidatus Sulfotelmatobacter sp.]